MRASAKARPPAGTVYVLTQVATKSRTGSRIRGRERGAIGMGGVESTLAIGVSFMSFLGSSGRDSVGCAFGVELYTAWTEFPAAGNSGYLGSEFLP